MSEQFSRAELLLGKAAMDRLAAARVAVFGIGGVGGCAVEGLVRGGIGALDLADGDRVALSNLNRQIIATHKTVGRYKAEAAAARIAEINPDAVVKTYNVFYSADTAGGFDLSRYDYVVDATDDVPCKLALAKNAQAAGVPLISSMGAGNKLNPAMFEVADIYDTSVCPLARVMRHELRKLGVESLKVVYSKEPPAALPDGVRVPGSVSFVPSVAGLIIAGEVIKDLCGIK